MNRYLDTILKYSYTLLSTTIFIICILGGLYVDYVYKLDVTKSNIYIFLLSACVMIVIYKVIVIVNKIIRKNIEVNFKILIIFISISLLFVQIIMIYFYYFRTGWDSYLIIDASYLLSENVKLQDWTNDYFSYYPNNIFITILFSKIIFLCKIIGVADYSYFVILVFQAILNIFTGFLVFNVIRKITQNINLSVFGYIFYVLLVGLSPWVSIPYSDSTALIIPVLMLYLHTNIDKEGFKIVGLSFLGVLGYMIKPQTAILFISIFLVPILFIRLRYIKKTLKYLSIALISILISYFFIVIFMSNNNITVNRELEISYPHFVKMGLNNVTNGGYLSDDAGKSMSFKSTKERKEENIEVIKERLSEYGIDGLLKHQIKKTLVTYNDGTFAWSQEGNFYWEIKEEKSRIERFFRNIYYESGSNHSIFKYIVQGAWLIILSIQTLTIFIKRENMENSMRVVLLSLIGLFVFESIFEARARYLYTYVPIFIVSGMIGLNEFLNWMKK